MPDLTSALLPALQANRIPELDLGGDFIYPAYAGQSALNLPASICHWLGVPQLGNAPLISDILDNFEGPFKRVVVILADALALHRLQRWMSDGSAPVWEGLAEKGILAPLTSLAPSTTSTVLPTLWSGASPAEHGMVGYELWLREYSVVSNMILHSPITYYGDVGSLSRAKFDPETFLHVPMLGTHLKEHGVSTHVYQPSTILGSGLSKILFKDTHVHGYLEPADLWLNVRQLFESRPDEHMYTWVYWPLIDTYSHKYGPDTEYPQASFANFSATFEREFLNALKDELREDTLLLLTADHGQITTHDNPHYDLSNHDNLARRLHMNPTGENRMMYLYIQPGQVDAVQEYIERSWPNQFSVVDSQYALHKGLFGPGEPDERVAQRLGELTVTARGDAYLWWMWQKANPLIGRHGGLTAEEMLVPLLGARLA
ncbi:MAG: hypothetical protein DWQ07_20195 [Chloroflexi bacterium]|nr:MAG: hypothetical protein DWQ07_20195 [Chloroflexota bacterium]MBL1194403.1 hypothetical protein [Chloroflexota bacterium]NOH11691.1 hypothetical protein [Chloroflexota bacterium]